MTAQYSEGPWSTYHVYGDVFEILDNNNDIIARTLETNADAEAEANARLMSLAPEMFEAVEQASRLHPHLVLCACTEAEPCYPRVLVTLLAKVSAS